MGFGSLNSQQRVMVLLELLGGPKFAAEMKGAAASTGLLGKNVDTMGKKMEQSARRTFMQNQALYTLRRYAFFGTIAVTAMGAAVLKLGYNYLSAMQQARVALSPVIKDHAMLEGYLNRLFQISKYSPFVLSDLAVGFRQMFAGLSQVGIGAPQILDTIQSLTDLMSFTGKTGPGAFQRVSLALQHMAYAGRLTGYAINQLSRDGIPIFSILNKELGITADQFHNISKMGIPAQTVLNAINKYAQNTPGIRGAALRLSLGTFHGLLQVLKDSVSQISGGFLKSTYGGKNSGIQGWLYSLLKPGGPLDKLAGVSTKQGGAAGILYLSKQLTGSSGLGKGLLLLFSTLQNIGRVFVHVIIPAWVLGAHALVIFYPILKAVNWGLGLLAKHGTAAKIIFAVLAAEFVITHFALIGLWTATKLYNIATLGSLGPLKKMIKFLWALRTVELASGIRSLRAYAFATSEVVSNLGGVRSTVHKNTGIVARFTRKVWEAVAAMKAYRLAAISAGFATALGIGLATGGTALLGFAAYKAFTTPNPTKIGPGIAGSRTNIVEASGRKYVQSQGGGRLTLLPSDNANLNLSGMTGAQGDTVVHTHVHIDRKQVAEAVSRAKADTASRR